MWVWLFIRLASLLAVISRFSVAAEAGLADVWEFAELRSGAVAADAI